MLLDARPATASSGSGSGDRRSKLESCSTPSCSCSTGMPCAADKSTEAGTVWFTQPNAVLMSSFETCTLASSAPLAGRVESGRASSAEPSDRSKVSSSAPLVRERDVGLTVMCDGTDGSTGAAASLACANTSPCAQRAGAHSPHSGPSQRSADCRTDQHPEDSSTASKALVHASHASSFPPLDSPHS